MKNPALFNVKIIDNVVEVTFNLVNSIFVHDAPSTDTVVVEVPIAIVTSFVADPMALIFTLFTTRSLVEK